MTSFDRLCFRSFNPPQPQSAPALLLHGFATTGLQQWQMTGWAKRLLAAGIPVLLADLPYHGVQYLKDSAPDSLRQGDIEDGVEVVGREFFSSIAAAIAGYIEELDTPVHLVGFSAGARIAYEVATEDSGLVRSLTVGGLPQHSDLVQLNAYLNPASSSPDKTAGELNPAFAPIIDQSVLTREALARFVSHPVDFEFDPDQHLPQAPTLVVSGTADTIAGDPGWLLRALKAHGLEHRWLELTNRDHVNALTSGVFKRETIAWIQQHQQG